MAKVQSIRPDVKKTILDGLDPDAYFIDFPLKEDFEEDGVEFFVSGERYPTINRIGSALVRAKLQPLSTVRLGFLWKRAGGSRANKAVLGKAMKASALVKTFTDRVGFVVLSADHVRNFKLTNYMIEALVYHELLHFRFEEGSLITVGHDFEAFGNEVEEYGLWKPDLKLAKEKFDQLELL